MELQRKWQQSSRSLCETYLTTSWLSRHFRSPFMPKCLLPHSLSSLSSFLLLWQGYLAKSFPFLSTSFLFHGLRHRFLRPSFILLTFLVFFLQKHPHFILFSDCMLRLSLNILWSRCFIIAGEVDIISGKSFSHPRRRSLREWVKKTKRFTGRSDSRK